MINKTTITAIGTRMMKDDKDVVIYDGMECPVVSETKMAVNVEALTKEYNMKFQKHLLNDCR